MGATPFRIGFLLFPRLTQLDLTGPYEILARLPGAELHLVAKTLEPVRSDKGLAILPTDTLETCPPLDLVCVPGGIGVNDVLTDADYLAFLRWMASEARYVTSVCTGSLALGAAGLLRGKRAACHWTSRDMLPRFGAIPVAERVVIDGNIITGGGVTAGIDFGLRVVAEIAGRDLAEAVQLGVEYDPAPPFASGSPERARPEIVTRVKQAAKSFLGEREAAVERAAAALAAEA